MKIVFDTNVLVSALLKSDSVPARILRAVWDGQLQLLLSQPLQEELERVLNYPKIRKRLTTAAVDVSAFLELVPFFTVSVDVTGAEAPTPRDVDDWMVLATLVAGQGEWLVTGDEDLLAFAQSYPVLTPSEFVARFLK